MPPSKETHNNQQNREDDSVMSGPALLLQDLDDLLYPVKP